MYLLLVSKGGFPNTSIQPLHDIKAPTYKRMLRGRLMNSLGFLQTHICAQT